MDFTKKTCSICQNGTRTARRMTGDAFLRGRAERAVSGGRSCEFGTGNSELKNG